LACCHRWLLFGFLLFDFFLSWEGKTSWWPLW
jgi:hypothetical protein